MITWDAIASQFLDDGAPVPPQLVSGAADALCSEINAQMRVISDRLQAGLIEIDEWRDSMRSLIKSNVIAQKALARGGFDHVSPALLRSWEADVIFHLERLDAFATEIYQGKYGSGVLNGRFLQRTDLYSGSGRAIYENERVQVQKESGHDWAQRIKGAVDNCPDCVEWADLGKIPIDDMMENYPIGASVCGAGRCHCVIITGRD